MTIDEIKSRLTIQEVLRHYNLRPDANSRLTCPWHSDTTPSLQVYQKTNTWKCFSSKCTAGSGDVIDFIMKYEKLSKRESLLKCKELLGHEPVRDTKGFISSAPMLFEKQSRQAIPTPEGFGKQATVMKFYRQLQYDPGKALHASAKNYLESRGIEGIQVAYCSGRSLSDWKRRNKDWYASIETYGLGRFRESLVFAMRNSSNQIVGLYGRKIKGAGHYYLSGPHEGLYPSWPSAETKRLILTESMIDTASLSQIEDYELLALYGTKGFTKDHAAAISGLANLEELILFMDGDKAGEEAIPELLEKVQAVNDKVTISKVNTPGGTDPNSLLQAEGIEVIRELIEARQELYSSCQRQTSAIEKEEVTPTRNPINKAGRLDASRQDLLKYEIENLLIWIMGGIKITSLDKLRVSLKIANKESEDLPIRESLDLYQGRSVDQLQKRMLEELQLGQSESRKVLSDLTNELDQYRSERLAQLENRKEGSCYEMDATSMKTAQSYLSDPDLIKNTVVDIAKSGIIGERENALIGYMIYLSRKRKKPLHVMYLGKSGSGKTYLQEKLSELIPEEDKKNVTALSDQSLYYQGKQLKGKVLLIEDIDGAENVMYAIREFQTKGWVSKTVAWKDPQGNMESKDIVAEGPLVISSCTTREKVYEDNANRCVLLYIDDSAAQDKRVMDYQKQLSAGLVKKHEQGQIRNLHQNVQRLLKPIEVINPYAIHIDLPQEVFRPRRSLQLLLGFIETVTFYHQYQREIKTDKDTGQRYIESTVSDVEISFGLLKEVLFRKSDELSGAARGFLEKLKEEVPTGQSFYTQDIRKTLRISSSTIHRYIGELREHGYLISKGGNRRRGYEYEIADYKEYERLRGDIARKIEEILTKIRK